MLEAQPVGRLRLVALLPDLDDLLIGGFDVLDEGLGEALKVRFDPFPQLARGKALCLLRQEVLDQLVHRVEVIELALDDLAPEDPQIRALRLAGLLHQGPDARFRLVQLRQNLFLRDDQGRQLQLFRRLLGRLTLGRRLCGRWLRRILPDCGRETEQAEDQQE